METTAADGTSTDSAAVDCRLGCGGMIAAIAVGALLYFPRRRHNRPRNPRGHRDSGDQRSRVLRAVAGRTADRLRRIRRWCFAPVGALAGFDVGAATAGYRRRTQPLLVARQPIARLLRGLEVETNRSRRWTTADPGGSPDHHRTRHVERGGSDPVLLGGQSPRCTAYPPRAARRWRRQSSARGRTASSAPRFLPGGRQFLFIVNGADPAIWLGSLDGAEPRRITAIAPGTDSEGEYLAPGWLVRVRQNVLVRPAFRCRPWPALRRPGPAGAGGGRRSSLTGRFLFGVAFRDDRLADRRGRPKATDLVQSLRSECGRVRRSGRLHSVQSRTLSGRQTGRNDARACGFGRPLDAGGHAHQPVHLRPGRRPVSRSGRPTAQRVVFSSNRKGAYDLYQKPANGSGSEEVLLQSADIKRPNSWSPDGRLHPVLAAGRTTAT